MRLLTKQLKTKLERANLEELTRLFDKVFEKMLEKCESVCENENKNV